MICSKRLSFRSNFHHTKRYISALYITGDKAKENYAVLHPYMNFSEVFDQTKEMEDNIKFRNLNLNFNNIKEKYKKFCKVENEKHNLEKRREDIANKLKMNFKNENKQSIQNLKNEGKSIREQLKSLKESIYPIEDEFIHDFLHLPNKLHKRCPFSDNTELLYRQNLPSSDKNIKSQNHLYHTNLIDFKDNTCYYLLNDAATFDLNFMHNCTEYFMEKNYLQMTNPDFARKILLEAAGVINENAFEEIQEEIDLPSKINSLHLNGGGSFTSFLGFVSKLSIFPSLLPMKLISTGRQYYTHQNYDVNKGLFAATQSNVVQVFVATETEEQADKEFDTLLNLYVNIYKKLGIHFQIIYETAKHISAAESLRASIQMYSPYYGEYIEVGNLSHYSDFISKRILFNFKNGKKYNFPQIIGGSVVNISKILACLIENNGSLKSPNYCVKKSSAVDNFKDLFG